VLGIEAFENAMDFGDRNLEKIGDQLTIAQIESDFSR
jgi:hypothetical protein